MKFKPEDKIIYTDKFNKQRIFGTVKRVCKTDFMWIYDILWDNMHFQLKESAHDIDANSCIALDYDNIWQNVLNESK